MGDVGDALDGAHGIVEGQRARRVDNRDNGQAGGLVARECAVRRVGDAEEAAEGELVNMALERCVNLGEQTVVGVIGASLLESKDFGVGLGVERNDMAAVSQECRGNGVRRPGRRIGRLVASENAVAMAADDRSG